ncbi:MAG: pyruvate kinase, partial [bacterium]|nr:pyruvate kinase [bacterium]
MGTKIICTIGPASESKDILEKLIEEGMAIARINFSHASHKEFKNKVEKIRKISKSIPILADLQGPKVRIGHVKNNKIYLKTGQKFILTTEETTSSENKVYVDFEELHNYLNKEDRIFLDDGKIELKVEKVKGKEIICKVIMGGILSSRKGVTILNKTIPLPGLTEQDYKDVSFALSIGIEYFAQSFVRKGEDVINLRNFLLNYNPSKKYFIIAKIEDYFGYKNIDEIIEVSDGIMVARGDLGVSVERALVPLIQKEIIEKCSKAKKVDIVATQMLDSMVENPFPTRAEVNDVAVAVFQGADYLLLSSETSIGKYPIFAVREMKRIIEVVENYL